MEGSGSQNKSFGKENLIYGEDKETARDLNECLLCKCDASTWQEYVHMRKKNWISLTKVKCDILILWKFYIKLLYYGYSTSTLRKYLLYLTILTNINNDKCIYYSSYSS